MIPSSGLHTHTHMSVHTCLTHTYTMHGVGRREEKKKRRKTKKKKEHEALTKQRLGGKQNVAHRSKTTGHPL